jgi:hypothetical protein
MYTIQGYVRDYISGESIPYANVFFMNTSTGDVTNQNGYFSLKYQGESIPFKYPI